jgi:hypothetical protein
MCHCQAAQQLDDLQVRLFKQLHSLLDGHAPDAPLTVSEFANFMYDLESDVFTTLSSTGAKTRGVVDGLSLQSLKTGKTIRM